MGSNDAFHRAIRSAEERLKSAKEEEEDVNTGNYSKVRVTEEIQYEYWDCAQCGQKRIRGDNQSCTNCGKVRDESVVFYADGEEPVTDPKHLKRFAAGADRVCEHCSSLIPANEPSCRACAAPTSAKAYKPKAKKRTHVESSVNASGDAYQRMENVTAGGTVTQTINPPTRPSYASLKLAVALGLSVAVLGLVLNWMFTTHAVQYQVKARHWERTIDVERYGWSDRVDWSDELKGDNVHIVSSSQEVRSYRRVLDGYRSETYYETERYKSGSHEDCTSSFKSLGNGSRKKVTSCRDVADYSTRRVPRTRQVPIYHQEPVYSTKCVYRSQAYAFLQTLRAEGTGNDIAWPVFPLSTEEVIDAAHADRPGKKTEDYRVTLTKVSNVAGPDSAVISTTEDRFKTIYTAQAVLSIPVNNLGSLRLSAEDTVR